MDMIGRTKNATRCITDPDALMSWWIPARCCVVGPNISSDDLEKTIETVNGDYQKLKLNHFYDVTAPDATHDNLGPQPARPAHLLPQRSLQFRQDGHPDRVLHHRAARGLSPRRPTRRRRSTTRRCSWSRRRWPQSAGCWATSRAVRKLNAKLPEQLVKDMKTAKEQGWGKDHAGAAAAAGHAVLGLIQEVTPSAEAGDFGCGADRMGLRDEALDGFAAFQNDAADPQRRRHIGYKTSELV